MFLSYFFGCWWLPVCLSLLDFDFVKLGEESVASPEVEKDEPVAIPQPEATHTVTEHRGAKDEDISDDHSC